MWEVYTLLGYEDTGVVDSGHRALRDVGSHHAPVTLIEVTYRVRIEHQVLKGVVVRSSHGSWRVGGTAIIDQLLGVLCWGRVRSSGGVTTHRRSAQRTTRRESGMVDQGGGRFRSLWSVLLVIAEDVWEDGCLRRHGLVLRPVRGVVVSVHPDRTGDSDW
jgi:hypothetical protein